MKTSCPVCDVEFEKTHWRQKCCSSACNGAAQRRKRGQHQPQGLKFCRSCREPRPLADFAIGARQCRECLGLKADGRKRCTACKQVKERSEFFPRKNAEGREPRCKVCSAAASRAYNSRPEIQQRTRNRHYLYRFGITAEEYDRRVAEQNGLCTICGRPPDGAGALHVDHDHRCCAGEATCGKCLRGLLCYSCNTALGAIRDNPETAEAMASYLRRYS